MFSSFKFITPPDKFGMLSVSTSCSLFSGITCSMLTDLDTSVSTKLTSASFSASFIRASMSGASVSWTDASSGESSSLSKAETLGTASKGGKPVRAGFSSSFISGCKAFSCGCKSSSEAIKSKFESGSSCIGCSWADDASSTSEKDLAKGGSSIAC